MNTLPITTKQNWVDRAIQFLRSGLGKKELTREEIIKQSVITKVDELLTSKIYKDPYTSAEIALFEKEFRKEVYNRLRQRRANHADELRIATDYHTKQIEEADKAAESLNYNKL